MSRFLDGYYWAKEQIMLGNVSKEELEAHSDSQGIDADDFDKGVRAALRESPDKEGLQ